MSAPEIHRFPLKSVEQRATVATAAKDATVAKAKVAAPPAETRVVYVEKKVASHVNAGMGMISQAAYANHEKVNLTHAYSSVRIGNQQMVAYDYTIGDELPAEGSPVWKVQTWNYLDPFAIRHVQVYERVCPTSCPSSCPENCIVGVPGLLVSTENPTTFGSSTRSKIVGAIPFSTYHTGDQDVTPTSLYKYSFVNLELSTITPTLATRPLSYLSTLLRSAEVDGAIVSGLTDTQVLTQAEALITAIQAEGAGVHDLTNLTTYPAGPYYVLVYCNGDKCSDSSVLDVFSWYLATLDSVTTTSPSTTLNGALATGAQTSITVGSTTGFAVGQTITIAGANPATVVITGVPSATVLTFASTVFTTGASSGAAVVSSTQFLTNITVKPLSPECEYPSDTVWARLRDKGNCISLPTAVNKGLSEDGIGFAIDPRDKVPVYFAVPSFKYKIGDDINSNNYSVSVPRGNYANKTDKFGAVPQGTASHFIGIQYCVKDEGECCPSVFSILAGQMCSCRLDSRIWGFRVMFYDTDSTSHRRADRWGQLIPQQFDAPSDYGNKPFIDGKQISWALTTESSTANGYSIADSVLQIPIERSEHTGANGVRTGENTISFTKICSTKFRVDFILNPDPEGSAGVTYAGTQGAGAPPMSVTTADANGFVSPPYTQGSGYRYQRLNVNCSKKFSVTDLQLHGALQDCDQDTKVLRQLRVHALADPEDIPVDGREIALECTSSNVTTSYHARLSEGAERKEFHLVTISNLMSIGTPFLNEDKGYTNLTSELYQNVLKSEGTLQALIKDALLTSPPLLSGSDNDGYTIVGPKDYKGDLSVLGAKYGLTPGQVYAILAVETAYGSLKYDFTMPPFGIRGLGETVSVTFPASVAQLEAFDF